MSVATSEAWIRVVWNKAGAVGVDLFSECYPEDIHEKHVRIKDFIQQIKATKYDGEAECARRLSECFVNTFKRLSLVLPEADQIFFDAAAAKEYTWRKVCRCDAPPNLRARHPEESDQSYEATICALSFAKLKYKIQRIGTHSLANLVAMPLAAGDAGNLPASLGLPAYGYGGASAAINGASNGAGTAIASVNGGFASGPASPIATKAATMSQARAAVPPGIKTTTPAGIKTTTPAGIKGSTTGGYKRALGSGGSSSACTTGIPKKQKKEQDQAPAEKTRVFRKLFEEFECSLAEKKSKAETALTNVSEMKDQLGDLYPAVKQLAQRELEKLNNMTPGTFRFSASSSN